MDSSGRRIGLTADLFDTAGRPVFGTAPLRLFADAGLEWEKLPPDGASISPASHARYDALFIGGAKVNEEALTQDNGRLRVLARNGVGFDALDIPALSRRGILVTNTTSTWLMLRGSGLKEAKYASNFASSASYSVIMLSKRGYGLLSFPTFRLLCKKRSFWNWIKFSPALDKN